LFFFIFSVSFLGVIQDIDLVSFIHRKGVNCRHLGRIRRLVQSRLEDLSNEANAGGSGGGVGRGSKWRAFGRSDSSDSLTSSGFSHVLQASHIFLFCIFLLPVI
jgi:hypothetical protein